MVNVDTGGSRHAGVGIGDAIAAADPVQLPGAHLRNGCADTRAAAVAKGLGTVIARRATITGDAISAGGRGAGAAIVALAAEPIFCQISATLRCPRRGRRNSAVKEVLENKDRIGDIESPVIVRVGCILAVRAASIDEEEGQLRNAVADVNRRIGVEVRASEGRLTGALFGEGLGRLAQGGSLSIAVGASAPAGVRGDDIRLGRVVSINDIVKTAGEHDTAGSAGTGRSYLELALGGALPHGMGFEPDDVAGRVGGVNRDDRPMENMIRLGKGLQWRRGWPGAGAGVEGPRALSCHDSEQDRKCQGSMPRFREIKHVIKFPLGEERPPWFEHVTVQ